MAYLPQHPAAVDTLTLPNSGVQITLRRNVTGRDRSESLAVAVKLRAAGFDAPVVYMRYLCVLAANLIVSWDATDEEGKPLPISPQQLGAIQDEADYNFLLDDVAGRLNIREDDPEKEGPFEKPSGPTSEDTSSTTLESSLTS